jgi:hypothetical protein
MGSDRKLEVFTCIRGSWARARPAGGSIAFDRFPSQAAITEWDAFFVLSGLEATEALIRVLSNCNQGCGRNQQSSIFGAPAGLEADRAR